MLWLATHTERLPTALPAGRPPTLRWLGQSKVAARGGPRARARAKLLGKDASGGESQAG